jgi:hypothetical protein
VPQPTAPLHTPKIRWYEHLARKKDGKITEQENKGKCEIERQRFRRGQHIKKAVAQKEERTWEEIEEQL